MGSCSVIPFLNCPVSPCFLFVPCFSYLLTTLLHRQYQHLVLPAFLKKKNRNSSLFPPILVACGCLIISRKRRLTLTEYRIYSAKFMTPFTGFSTFICPHARTNRTQSILKFPRHCHRVVVLLYVFVQSSIIILLKKVVCCPFKIYVNSDASEGLLLL